MELFTKEILDAFRKQKDEVFNREDYEPKDIKIICKLFNPVGAGTWYVYDYDPEDDIAYAFVNLLGPDCAECGAVSMQELREYRPYQAYPIGIERDLHFDIGSMTLAEVKDKIFAGEHV